MRSTPDTGFETSSFAHSVQYNGLASPISYSVIGNYLLRTPIVIAKSIACANGGVNAKYDYFIAEGKSRLICHFLASGYLPSHLVWTL